MQYGHCVVSATAIAINSLYFRGIAPSFTAASSNATNALNASGANSPNRLNFPRFFMSYMVVLLRIRCIFRPIARDITCDSVDGRTLRRVLDANSALQVHPGGLVVS